MIVGSAVTMRNAEIVCDPVFIPNAIPEKHMLFCKVVPQIKTSSDLVYDTFFWGIMAEVAAQTIKFEDVITLTGCFECHKYINPEGHKSVKVAFNVENARLAPADHYLQRFTFKFINTTGIFGNARIWTKGLGFTAPEQH